MADPKTPPVYVAVEREFLRSLVHAMAENATAVHGGVRLVMASDALAEGLRDILADADAASDRMFELARKFAVLVNG